MRSCKLTFVGFFLFFFSELLCSISSSFVKMYTTKQKIHKDKDAEPTEFEESVAQVLKCFCCCLICETQAKLNLCFDDVCFFFSLAGFL